MSILEEVRIQVQKEGRPRQDKKEGSLGGIPLACAWVLGLKPQDSTSSWRVWPPRQLYHQYPGLVCEAGRNTVCTGVRACRLPLWKKKCSVVQLVKPQPEMLVPRRCADARLLHLQPTSLLMPWESCRRWCQCSAWPLQPFGQ